jgi:hypothetical protein
MLGIGINPWWPSTFGSGGSRDPYAIFSAGPYTEGANDSAVQISINSATIGAAWDISVSSSGGGTPVTDSGTVAAANFSRTLNLTPLNPGTLTVTYSEDAVVISTATALLIAPFDVGLLDFSRVEASQYVSLI